MVRTLAMKSLLENIISTQNNQNETTSKKTEIFEGIYNASLAPNMRLSIGEETQFPKQ